MAEGARPELFQRKRSATRIGVDSGNIAILKSVANRFSKGDGVEDASRTV